MSGGLPLEDITTPKQSIPRFKNDVVDSNKNKVKILSYMHCFISIMVVLLVFGLTWMYPRHDVTKTSHSFAQVRTKSRLLEITSFLQYYLEQGESIATHLALLSERSDDLRCNKKLITTFIYYCSLTSGTNSYLTDFVLANKNESFCEYRYIGNGKYDIYYTVGDKLKIYDGRTSFDNWDPSAEGDVLRNINYDEFYNDLTQGLNSPFWSDLSSVDYINEKYLKFIYPFIDKNGNITTISAIGFNVRHLTNFLTETFKNFHWMIYFETQRSTNVTIYSLANNDKNLWNIVFKNMNGFNNETATIIEINETSSFSVMKNNLSMNGNTFQIFIGYEREYEVKGLLMYGSKLFLISLNIVIVICIFLFYLYNKIRNNTLKKLKVQVVIPGLKDEKPVFLGKLGESIQIIHQIQLSYPDETLLNKILDSTISNLTEAQRHLFVERKKLDCDCELCKLLFSNESVINEDCTEIPFETWKAYFKANFYCDYSTLNWKEIDKNPKLFLVKYFINIITSKKLIFLEIDPDSFIKFLIEYVENYLTSYKLTISMIYYLNFLIQSNFNNWILNKEDLFILYFCGLTYFAKVEDDNDILNNSYFSYEFKINSILNLFFKNVPATKSEFFAYFKATFKDIMYGMQDFNNFNLYGEICCRVESYKCSVQTNLEDLHLFMKGFLKLCSYSCFWSQNQVMLRCFKEFKTIMFDKSELDDYDFIKGFIHEFSSKIVLSWLRLFQNFAPLIDAEENLKKNMRYFENQHTTKVVISPLNR